MKIRKSLMLLLALGAVTLSQAQTVKVLPAQSKITVSGTSTLHDWEMGTSSITGSSVLEKSGDQITINTTKIVLKAAQLESESSGMDEKAHEALQVKKYADISFTQTGTATAQLKGTKFSTTVSGTLTIAGKTRRVNLGISGDTANGQLKVTGAADLKMTDFDINPPRAMLGAVRAGDEIKVNYEVLLK